jgi:cell division protein FtsQ
VSAVAAPADRRFRRAHIKPGRARRGWRRIAPVVRSLPVVLLLAYVAYLGARTIGAAGVLTVRRIVVTGNTRLSEAEVLALLGGLRGESLLSTDLDRWRESLLASPWVQNAALRRSLPSTVEIALEERQPIGIGRFDDDMYLIDARGTILDQYGPRYADIDLPLVDGVAVKGGAAPAADEVRADLAARVIRALKAGPDGGRRLSQVDVSDVHNAKVILAGDSAVVALGEDQFLARLQSYLELAGALRERVADIDYVDVRFEKRVYVRPMKKAR